MPKQVAEEFGGEEKRRIERWLDEIEKVIAGKRGVIELIAIACLAEGHVLLEDVPGVGKTTLVQALASSLGCGFKRIQFTPDLLPSDITGCTILEPQTMEPVFRPGPLMANIVLADEVNRASPKTQSALLEAMEEGKVTADGVTYALPRPFFLLATQNPLRHEGTYPLPEAQMDRFMFRLGLGYPAPEQEVGMLERVRLGHPLERVEPVFTAETLLKMQQRVRGVHVDAAIKHYIVRLADATRRHPEVELGASPRASIALMRAAQARAWMDGRTFVIPDDVKTLAARVFGHRIVLKPEAGLLRDDVTALLEELIRSVPVPFLSPHGTRGEQAEAAVRPRRGWFT